MSEPVLRKGSTDPAVRDLQDALNTLGHDPGPIDGVFGTETEAAVRAFQQSKGITVDGIVGRVTWINIDEADQNEPVLRNGSTGLPVRRLQSRTLTPVESTDALAQRQKRQSASCNGNPASVPTGSLARERGSSSMRWRT